MIGIIVSMYNGKRLENSKISMRPTKICARHRFQPIISLTKQNITKKKIRKQNVNNAKNQCTLFNILRQKKSKSGSKIDCWAKIKEIDYLRYKHGALNEKSVTYRTTVFVLVWFYMNIWATGNKHHAFWHESHRVFSPS